MVLVACTDRALLPLRAASPSRKTRTRCRSKMSPQARPPLLNTETRLISPASIFYSSDDPLSPSSGFTLERKLRQKIVLGCLQVTYDMLGWSTHTTTSSASSATAMKSSPSVLTSDARRASWNLKRR